MTVQEQQKQQKQFRWRRSLCSTMISTESRKVNHTADRKTTTHLVQVTLQKAEAGHVKAHAVFAGV